jgi:hypothetical protein
MSANLSAASAKGMEIHLMNGNAAILTVASTWSCMSGSLAGTVHLSAAVRRSCCNQAAAVGAPIPVLNRLGLWLEGAGLTTPSAGGLGQVANIGSPPTCEGAAPRKRSRTCCAVVRRRHGWLMAR